MKQTSKKAAPAKKIIPAKKVKKTNLPEPTTIIQNCKFVATEWDKSVFGTIDNTVRAIQTGLEVQKTAMEGLKNITELFKRVDVRINSMLSVTRNNVLIADNTVIGDTNTDTAAQF